MALNVPPNARITIATPRLEPVEMPSMEGSARGLLNVVWSSKPDTASAAPESTAVIAIGSRDSKTITSHTSFSISKPKSERNTCSAGISTEPKIRHAGKSKMRIMTDELFCHYLLCKYLFYKFIELGLFSGKRVRSENYYIVSQ